MACARVQAGTYAFQASVVREPVVPARIGATAGVTLTVVAQPVLTALLRLSGASVDPGSFLPSNPLSLACDVPGGVLGSCRPLSHVVQRSAGLTSADSVPASRLLGMGCAPVCSGCAQDPAWERLSHTRGPCSPARG